MKKSLFLVSAIIALLFSGCGLKPYVDVTSKDYATLQLVPKSKTLIFKDDYYANITDFSDGCDYNHDKSYLGAVKTDSDTPSRVVKIPSEKPLLINANYVVESNGNTYVEYNVFLLTPKKNKNYIVEYVKKDLGLFKGTISDFYVYEKVGDKEVKIPKSRIVRSFDYSKECNK